MAGAARCGGDGGGAPGNVDEFNRRLNEALCTMMVACGDMPDKTTCLASLQLDTTELLTLKADIASGKVQYDSAKAGACLAYWERFYGAGCMQTARAAVATTGSEACDEAFVGTVADGGACTTSFQCASDSCALTDQLCPQDRQCCPGSCAAKIPAGADCGGSLTNLNCERGSVCTVSAAVLSPKCITPSKVAGTPCIVAYECEPPLFCDIDVNGNGTCQPVAATGAPCNSYVALGVCDDLRDFCGVATDTCAPRGKPGAACSFLDPNNCLGYAQCIGSTCVAHAPASGACYPASGPGCLGSLECSTQTNTCEFPAVAGACS
jgi:hypothetical protein